MKKTIVGTCVSNPFKTVEALRKVLDGGKEITRDDFLERCEVDPQLEQDMKGRFQYDFKFYLGYYQNKPVLWFTHSATEHFYM